MPAWTATTQTSFRCLLLAVAACFAHAAVASADDLGGESVRIQREGAAPTKPWSRYYTPLQVSLFPVAQVFPSDWNVTGVSFNILYGEQRRLMGVGFGLFNTVTSELWGVQAGVANIVEGKATGLQFGMANMVGNDLDGLQVGFFNRVAKTANGIQMGIVNDAGSIRGAQLGAVNFAETLRGVQIGLSNLNRAGPPLLRFIPLVNVGW